MSIQINGLGLDHPEGKRQILNNITLTLQEKHITLLLGKTGAGKSTLLDIMSGLHQMDRGAILYGGRPLWVKQKPQLVIQRAVGQVFQFPEQQLFARTVQGEFDYSLRPYPLSKSERVRRTEEALLGMGLPQSWKERSPFQLSGGQKRRVALATTLATEPEWLLLDEPTAGLDADSSDRLIQQLTSMKAAMRGGIVIATHDLDAFWEVADYVVMLRGGEVAAQGTPAQLRMQPEVWERAGLAPPASVEVAWHLSALGMHMPEGVLTPGHMAEHIMKHVQCAIQAGRVGEMSAPDVTDDNQHASHRPSTESAGPYRQREDRESAATITETSDLYLPQTSASLEKVHGSPASASIEPEGIALEKADPRGKWIVYMLWSIAILLQDAWVGVWAATLITAAVIVPSGLSPGKLFSMIRPFLILIIVSVGLSGVRIGEAPSGVRHLGSVYFEMEGALVTLMELWKILLIMVLGFVLQATTSALSMKKGLEQSLAPLRKIKIPVDILSLAASLILRFIPLLMREAERFSRIVRARGKQTAKPGRIRLRDMPVMVIPLILSLFQIASDLSTALEAKGYKAAGMQRAPSRTLRMVRGDYVLMAAGGAIFILLMLLSLLV
ncbi:ATP-binding cassette domain-containing protein [Marinicrinis lubricantis]|uniref:ATP-binding cassette domain-containing protein n=1 Tax=Marinicrinis lubricantis TaxID=2086470 RepID=A0ABW1ITY6_9BACL